MLVLCTITLRSPVWFLRVLFLMLFHVWFELPNDLGSERRLDFPLPHLGLSFALNMHVCYPTNMLQFRRARNLKTLSFAVALELNCLV